MQSLKIYVARENIENEFSLFLKNDKKIIWSIYGAGGIGKTTLLNRFFEQTKEDGLTTCFFDYANHAITKITGLDILLYNLVTNDCKTFEKLKKIISKKYTSISQHLSKLGDTAGSVPMKSINSLIVELDKDAEYTKELGLIWATIIDTIKVGAKLFNRDKKNEIIFNNPELHLVTALLADMEKHKRGMVFVDTFEKFKDITVSTTLHIIGGELISSNEEYKLSLEQYLTLILNFLYEKREKANIKTIIAGRTRLSKVANYNLIHIKQSVVNKFEPEQIVSYINQIREYLPDFPLPSDDIINDIQEITKGNPLILEYLIQFIIDRYEDEWTWKDWNELKKEFKNSDDENGLIYYLTDRIATHLTGWENSLWKLTIPLELSPEIAEIIYPKTDENKIYGKDFFKLLHRKGILKKGRKLDNNYYLFDELKSSLEAYKQKEFSKNGNNPFDNKELIELHTRLRNYYDKLANWQDYPKEFSDKYLETNKNTNKQELFYASYHAFGAKENFEKDFAYLKKDRFEFWEMFVQSFTTTYAFIRWVADNLDTFFEFQLKKYISIFTNEEEEFEKIYTKEFNEYLRNLKLNNKLPNNWDENEIFLLSALEKYPNEAGLLENYALFLDDIKKNYDKAEEFYLKAIEANPKDANNLRNYASFLKNIKKDYDKADEFYLKAIEANPKDENALGNYIYFLNRIKKDYDKAEEFYLKAIEANPKDANNLRNYASFLKNIKKDYDKADEYYLKAIDANPQNSKLYYCYAIFLKNIKKDYNKANEYFSISIEVAIRASNYGSHAVFLHMIKKDYEQAEKYYQISININPKNTHNLGNYAVFLSEIKKNYDLAEKYYLKTIEVNKKNTNNLVNYAVFLDTIKKDYNKAEKYYLKAIETNPKDADLFGNYATFLYVIKKNYALAEKYYQKSIKVNKKNKHIQMYFGQFYLRRGNLELAKKYFEKSVELGSNDLGNMNLGHVYFAEGDKQKAYQTYKKSIENFEDKNKFFEGFDNDFQYLEQYGITKEDYNEMKNKLAC